MLMVARVPAVRARKLRRGILSLELFLGVLELIDFLFGYYGNRMPDSRLLKTFFRRLRN
jgi:hypothetical protein